MTNVESALAGCLIRNPSKWDIRFLRLAEFWSAFSKDPSTKCGAVLAKGKEVVNQGYNGFSEEVEDRPEWYADRAIKLGFVVHAEVNAVKRAGHLARGSTLYTWPIPSCEDCAAVMLRAGVARFVAPYPDSARLERWGDSFLESLRTVRSRDVPFELVPRALLGLPE